MKVLLALTTTLLLSGCLTTPVNAPPGVRQNTASYFVYFVCPQCKSLDGGCYRKALVKSHRTKQGLTCRHTWTRITQEEFDAKARQHEPASGGNN